MGCGASVDHPKPQIIKNFTVKRVLGKRKDSTSSSTSSEFHPPMDQQMKALCFANVRSIFHRKNAMVVGVPRSNPRRRRVSDSRFIEQRIVCDDSDESEVDDSATNKTESTTLTRSTFESGKSGGDVTKKDGDGQPRSFFRIAMDYNKRMDAIKNFRPKKSSVQPTPVFPCSQHRESLSRLSEPAAIIQHVSRREFLENSSCIATPPLVRRVITPTNGSIRGSQETLMSERSFIVVHNTLRVAWEKEMCYERIQEQKRQNRIKQAHLRWHSVDSSCAETSSESTTEDSNPVFGTNRIEWSRELDEIVRLD